MSGTTRFAGGPWFDELVHGQVFDTAPGVTLTDGLAAVHQSILGDRQRLPLDRHLAAKVTGQSEPIAHPALVWDVAIGQSTLATHHVKANLFYRGLIFRRFPHLGDTLSTRTEVVGLKENTVRPGRPATGLAALRMVTTDQHDRIVLDFHRCAMLPLGPDAGPDRVVHGDDLSAVGADAPTVDADPGWNLDPVRTRSVGDDPAVGDVVRSSGDVVTGAPELARLSLNLAAVHHDERVSGRRLVYGGHTIGLALAQATRALPDLITVLGWRSCDHTGPVHEGDTLTSTLEVLAVRPHGSGRAVDLRSIVHSHRGGVENPVLDWRFTALLP
ncbi:MULTISPECIES: MaoC family dehydratase [Nocardiaceae]|uniref:Acyl dehydratase n=1 Tax=Rhodococcoides kroppenstedtii TaxID=293050 RepID=A0ABS7NTT1_9NOCA|nr:MULTISPECIES: MaoC family dehydratase [Rhodococcus]AMY20370.1 Beta-methylmalyl-CoA dehydratase [Rhodococcus sp. PBTS 1]MBY6313893.1 acyl dehydratase [Rhodococcus kroppenstedtii]MBY6321396.1 acyl dehydratase [Rhodococcus kroppenstedtii]MBY6400095.1 acyl dehydratase [Rhodococcus kroppenstedtii]MBY6438517.1 acyl dehydratase [Rhodococcus kroppenstedtii]